MQFANTPSLTGFSNSNGDLLPEFNEEPNLEPYGNKFMLEQTVYAIIHFGFGEITIMRQPNGTSTP